MLNAIPKKALLIAIALFFTVLSAGGARTNAASGSSVYINPDWCAVGGSVNISWRIDGGAPPYTVSVAGIVAETDDEHLTLPCADLRAWVTDGVLRQHVEVVLSVRVVDANEMAAAARLTMLLLAAAPQNVPQEIDLFVGYSDVHVRTLSFMPASEWRPVPSVVLIRYRPLGAVCVGVCNAVSVGSPEWSIRTPFAHKRSHPRNVIRAASCLGLVSGHPSIADRGSWVGGAGRRPLVAQVERCAGDSLV